MAQGSIKSPMAGKVAKQEGINARRNYTGKKGINNEQIPNYLRASTGSCHDLCKYGGHHTFEAKAKSPIPRRTPSPRDHIQTPAQSVSVADRKKTTVTKLKPSYGSKNHFPANPKLVNREGSSPSRKEDSLRAASPNHGKRNPSSNSADSLKSKIVTGDPSASANAIDGLDNKSRNGARIGKKKGTSQVEKKGSTPLIAALSFKPSFNRVASVTKHRSLKVVSHMSSHSVNRVIGKSEPKQLSKEANEKTVQASNTKINVKKYSSVKAVAPLDNKSLMRKAESKKLDRDTGKETSGVKNLKVLPLVHQNKKEEPLKVTEENPHIVFEMETLNKKSETHAVESPRAQLDSPSLSAKSSSHLNSPFLSSQEGEEDEQESEYTTTEADDGFLEDNEIANSDVVESSELDHRQRFKEAGLSFSEYKISAPVKLKFREGKVIDLQSENNVPQRLRFRQERVLAESQNVRGNVGRRSFKRSLALCGRRMSNSSSGKVVLKHRDVEGRKDAQGLLNNVIEETASKLVETRKSKVMALVGAFETVISLQDNKSLTSAVA